jgi:dTDP-4-dehydrorhamnose 3,5-epimerase
MSSNELQPIVVNAIKDVQTVTPTGKPTQELIDGVSVRHSVTQADERGSVTEMFDERWAFDERPVPYVYATMVRPGQCKGWVVHLEQDDRLFFLSGSGKLALYDAREGSPTFGFFNVFFLGDHDRGIVRIPAGVVHGVRNVGSGDLLFVNMPTRPYDHENPDKYRFPNDGGTIPHTL